MTSQSNIQSAQITNGTKLILNLTLKEQFATLFVTLLCISHGGGMFITPSMTSFSCSVVFNHPLMYSCSHLHTKWMA